jgi:hypothetical protein
MQFASDAINLLDLITKIDLVMCKNTLISEIMKYNAMFSTFNYYLRSEYASIALRKSLAISSLLILTVK